jgi:hypothetical protein
MSRTPYEARTSTLFKPFQKEQAIKADSRLMEVLLTNDDYFSDKLTWCLEHCQSKFRDLSDQHGRIWYFQNEHDATMFAMRWA